MNTNRQNRQNTNLYLDSVGSAAVLIAAILIVATAAIGSFTDSTDAPTQMARQGAGEPSAPVTVASQDIGTGFASGNPSIVLAKR